MEAPIDMDRLSLAGGSKAEQKELLDLFFRLADEKLVTMEAACWAGNAEEWRRAAHYLKGSATNLGMNHLTQLCQDAEKISVIVHEETLHLLEQIRTSLHNIKEYIGQA